MNIRPIQTGDLEYVRQNPYQESVKDMPNIPMPINAFACEHDDEVIGIGGINILYPGVGEAWLMLTKHANKETIFGFRKFCKIRETMDAIIAENGLWRVEAQARVDSLESIRLIKVLGFEQICVRKKYCPDKTDMVLFEKLIDEPV